MAVNKCTVRTSRCALIFLYKTVGFSPMLSGYYTIVEPMVGNDDLMNATTVPFIGEPN